MIIMVRRVLPQTSVVIKIYLFVASVKSGVPEVKIHKIRISAEEPKGAGIIIKRVYSIWVCMNMEENSLSHIHLVKDDLVGYHDWRGKLDLFNIVMIGLSKELPQQDEQYELHRLLGALFAEGLTAGERLNIIKEEYDIPIEQNIEQEVDVMCNLSQGIKEAGIEEGRKEGREEGREEGRKEGRVEGRKEGRSEGRAEEIIETGYEFGLSEQDILERLQKKLSISLQKAQEYLLMFGKRTV